MNQSDFLFEIGTEELPPKELTTLINYLADSFKKKLNEIDISYNGCRTYATPRRLAVLIEGINLYQKDHIQEKLGPFLNVAYDTEGQPTSAAIGFAKACNCELKDIEIINTEKGKRLSYKNTIKGQATKTLLPNLIEDIIYSLPSKKKMHWGNYQTYFIRPVKWLVALIGDTIVPVNLFDINSDRLTYGHRFHANQSFKLEKASDYEEILEKKGFVIADFTKRKTIIVKQLEKISQEIDATVVVENSLLDEVTALVEWPISLLGSFNTEFLTLPEEVLISTMKTHQRYFHVTNNKAKLLPYFVTVVNINSTNPQIIIDGNEKVITPRLQDAEFFYNSDLKITPAEHNKKLATVVFQKQLGTILDKTQRIAQLAEFLAPTLHINSSLARQAGSLCKFDLVSGIVQSFPELQGIMGKYYALAHQLDPSIAQAIEEHYLPKFANDQLPETDLGSIISIADKLDTLVGIFAINQIPTGSKDPFAIRRSSIGLLRIMLNKQYPIDLTTTIEYMLNNLKHLTAIIFDTKQLHQSIINYLKDRLKSLLIEEGYDAGLIDALISLKNFQPTELANNLKSLNNFIINNTLDSKKIIENYRRIERLLQNHKHRAFASIDTTLFEIHAEQELWDLYTSTKKQISNTALPIDHTNSFINKLTLLNTLSVSINNFFEQVFINCENLKIRENRLCLLYQVKKLFLEVANFSHITDSTFPITHDL